MDSAVVGWERMGTPFPEIFGLLMLKEKKNFPVSESKRIIYTRFKKIAFHFSKVFQNFSGKNYTGTGERKRLACLQTNAVPHLVTSTPFLSISQQPHYIGSKFSYVLNDLDLIR